MALNQNIPLNIKNSLRCYKKCYFVNFCDTNLQQANAWNTLFAGAIEENALALRNATVIHSVAVD